MKFMLYLTGILLLSLALVSCGGKSGTEGESASSEVKSGSVTFVFSGNVGGMVNPCGCRIPLGGMGRRATVIKDIKSETDNVLVFDSGSMLFSGQYLYEPFDVIGKWTSHFIAELVNNIGIDALNISAYDLANGPDSLLVFDNMYDSKWLSGNVVRRDSGETIFDSSVTYNLGDFTVGVFGFMDDNPMGVELFREDEPVKVLDPFACAKNEVAKLKGNVDIIVAMAYMDIGRAKRVAEENPEINVLIISHTRQHNPSSEHADFMPERVGNTLIVRSPDGGRVVNRLDLNIVKDSYDFTDEDKYIDLRPEAIRAQDPTPTTSTYKHEIIDLGKDIEKDTAVQAKIQVFADTINAYTKLNEIEYKVP